MMPLLDKLSNENKDTMIMGDFKVNLINCNDDKTIEHLKTVEHFLKIIEKLLDKHATYENIKHPKSQFETKPWITAGLAYSIKIKNKLYKSFCKEKDPHKKENYERQFKTYRNLISTLLRETKESYYKQYFSDNKKT